MEAPGKRCPRALLLGLLLPVSLSVRLLSDSPLRCSRQDVACSAARVQCVDGFDQVHRFPPSELEDLQVGLEFRQDEGGALQPVLSARWSLGDDVAATQLRLQVLSTNQNECVRYTFPEKTNQRRSSGKKWSFQSDQLVLDPGQLYKVSVFNVPPPGPNRSHYYHSADLSVPGCEDQNMRNTQVCTETGSLWKTDLRVETDGGGSALNVSFSPDPHTDLYRLLVSCSSNTRPHIHQVNTSAAVRVNVSFSLDKWPRTCCQFKVEIQPFFHRCSNDCTRVRRQHNICSDPPSDPPYVLVVVGVASLCVVALGCVYFLCRRSGGVSAQTQPTAQLLQVKRRPKVLLIYSQDHRLYRDVVLQLAAFLQDPCGAEVLVDLLDSGGVSQVGGARWLQMQQQRLQPGDKVLLLCSRGVRAKWRALCGEGPVALREDELSPSGDILTAFLNLFLPSMHRAGALGRYVVAYFEELSEERDVPSLFDVAVKYALMSHVEELLFRILDQPQYQPGRVSRLQGVDLSCPSGRALRDAIHAFQQHQRLHPDWFQRECVSGQEEELTQHTPTLRENLHTAPVLQCVPVIRAGCPAFRSEVNVQPESCSVKMLRPHVNTQRPLLSVARPQPRPHATSGLVEVSPAHLHQRHALPAEEEEERSPSFDLSAPSEHLLLSPPPPHLLWDSQQEEWPLKGEGPLMEEESLMGEGSPLRGKCVGGDSDQGYASQKGGPSDDALQALVLLQEALLEQSLSSSALLQ